MIVLLPLVCCDEKRVSSGLLCSMWLQTYLDTWCLYCVGLWGNNGTYCSPFTMGRSFFWTNLEGFFCSSLYIFKTSNTCINLISYNLICCKYLQKTWVYFYIYKMGPVFCFLKLVFLFCGREFHSSNFQSPAFVFTVTLEQTLLLLCLRSSLVF